MASFSDMPSASPMSIHDLWQHVQQRQLSDDVFFEQLPFSSTSFGNFCHFGTVVNLAKPCIPYAGGELDATCMTSCKAATTAAAAPMLNAVQDPGEQFENDIKNIVVQHDVKHVHFADVPADVRVFNIDVNVDAKDQAVLSCYNASSESSSSSEPRVPRDQVPSAALTGDAFAARPRGSMASLRRQGDGCIATATQAKLSKDVDGMASHGAPFNSNLCGHPQEPRHDRHQCSSDSTAEQEG